MRRVIIFGGYGVFGSHIARALTAWGIPITIAGRNLREAEKLAHHLGGDCRALMCDLARPVACRAALAGHGVAVNAAGPFQGLDTTLLESCLEAGCDYADIADDRGYVARVRSLHDAFAARKLAAVVGCSSLPGISGALASLLRETVTAPVARARVTMFIGSKNAKGRAALRSFLSGLGKKIAAPQGTLLGFRDREVVPLPPPFGSRGVFNFDAPDYDLLPCLLNTPSVSVKVGFESRLATGTFALIARLGLGRFMEPLPHELPGRMLSWFGCRGGAVMVELFLGDGSVRRAALVSSTAGQRMAALPCAIVARTLAQDGGQRVGVATAYEFLGARELLEQLAEEGFAWREEGR